jgi:hypothetical protein
MMTIKSSMLIAMFTAALGAGANEPASTGADGGTLFEALSGAPMREFAELTLVARVDFSAIGRHSDAVAVGPVIGGSGGPGVAPSIAQARLGRDVLTVGDAAQASVPQALAVETPARTPVGAPAGILAGLLCLGLVVLATINSRKRWRPRRAARYHAGAAPAVPTVYTATEQQHVS